MTKLLTLPEVSEITRLSKGTIYSYIATRRIPFIKLGRRVLFSPDKIQKWIEKRQVHTIRNTGE